MKHPITAQQWNDYLDGEGHPDERAGFERHLDVCAECRQRREELVDGERLLREAGEQARRETGIVPEQLHRARHAFFAQVREQAAAEGAPVHDNVERLHNLLAPMCGSHTAHLVLKTAAVEGMTAKHWPDFLANVVRVLRPLCGEPAARLIWEAGRV